MTQVLLWVAEVFMLVWRAGACASPTRPCCSAARVATAPQFWLPCNAQFVFAVQLASLVDHIAADVT